eukprot:jgi/Botrbrau1/2692/Bobra.0203s0035.1
MVSTYACFRNCSTLTRLERVCHMKFLTKVLRLLEGIPVNGAPLLRSLRCHDDAYELPSRCFTTSKPVEYVQLMPQNTFCRDS